MPNRWLHGLIALAPAACSASTSAPPAEPPGPSPAMAAAIAASQPPEVEAPKPAPPLTPVEKGELPWWHELRAGVYRFRGRTVVLGVGRSTNHHHVVEGFMKSKVKARLSVRRAADRVVFKGAMPEPRMVDLFVTRENRFLSLYELEVPSTAKAPEDLPALEIPTDLKDGARRRVGRHVYDGPDHLFLECEIEGPIANPDWGQSKASAFLFDGR